jgi:hypothetical protein
MTPRKPVTDWSTDWDHLDPPGVKILIRSGTSCEAKLQDPQAIGQDFVDIPRIESDQRS